ncbi:MAG: redoxin domain-containing protein [Bacteroidota bacterium]
MKKALFFVFALFFIAPQSWADNGYRIEVNLLDFEGDEIYLGYHYGDKQYIKDTVQMSENGNYVFEGEEPLDGGMYLIVLPPDNQFIQVLVDEQQQHFSLSTTTDDPVTNIEIKGSAENQLFYDYMGFLDQKRELATPLQEEMGQEKLSEARKAELQKQLDAITAEVNAYQQEIMKKHTETLTAAIIRSGQELKTPEFTGDKQEYQRWDFFKKHWFDNLNMADPRLLRSPVQFQKVDQYMTKLVAQHPDSLIIGVDRVLKMVEPSQETFQFYLIHFLNVYAKSKIVGMDAVYVHIIEDYYAKGRAPWTEEEQLNKIIDSGRKLAPLLIGKQAPKITMYKKDGSTLGLYDVKSEYTVLFFWDPDCGHCKKSMPDMIKFYNDYKDKGVEVFAVCTKLKDAEAKCWDMIDEKGMDIWINVSDKMLRSRFKQLYDIRTTPQVYVLDKDKKIISKRLGADQLGTVIDNLIQMKKEEKKP